MPEAGALRHLTLLLVLATAASQAGELDREAQARALVQSRLVDSPYRLSEAARAGTIRYTLRLDPVWTLPETSEQHVQMLDDGQRLLTVCADCGREPAPARDALRALRQPNAWVNSDARAVRRFAAEHAGRGEVAQQMGRLAIAVRQHMTGAIEFSRYDDAATALERRSGDCTEFAVLLAAAARARGIAARVAYGVSYSNRFSGRSHVFTPHAWVQAWDGTRWRSFDAALGRFDAGHLALYIGDGRMNGLGAVTRVLATLRIVDAQGLKQASAAG